MSTETSPNADEQNGEGDRISKRVAPILIWLAFEAIAVGLWLALGNAFYLFNFTYIGTAVAAGAALYARGYRRARTVVQLAVGLYMLIGLGVLGRENMQIEGFWYYLFSGTFQAALIHYLVAKIAGPLLFGRGWCGYACWTAMVLDLLPFKTPREARRVGLGKWRAAVFAVSLIYVITLFLFYKGDLERVMLISFIAGNALYYAAGIALAYRFADNRAFCKYLCPVTVFLKPASYYSLMRVTVDENACTACGRCKRACPMDVDITDNQRSRRYGTECILCFECAKVCPRGAVK